MDRYYINVSGIVQGVGFRYFVYYSARTYGLTGWVRNCYDGSVEMQVQGSGDNISAFIEKLKGGNGYCEVENISSEKVSIKENERDFRIII